MRIWIDTEFNEFRGDLISLALVDENGREFYEVLPCENPGNWVAANVMPILNKQPISKQEMQLRLMAWLNGYESVHIIADWPEDIQHLCETFIVGPGVAFHPNVMTMEIRRDLEGQSQLPHNALADAKANRLAYLEKEVA